MGKGLGKLPMGWLLMVAFAPLSLGIGIGLSQGHSFADRGLLLSLGVAALYSVTISAVYIVNKTSWGRQASQSSHASAVLADAEHRVEDTLHRIPALGQEQGKSKRTKRQRHLEGS